MNEKEYQTVFGELMKLQGNDRSGHGIDHVFRVVRLSEQFCDQLPDADRDIVMMTALLHDADDYKLTGRKDGSLDNAQAILSLTALPEESIRRILKGISTIGYS